MKKWLNTSRSRFLYILDMKLLKLLSCLSFIALLGCASSEPVVQQQDSNADEVRANAAKAYSELDAEK
ncbi:hypothetical protein SAMN05720489_1065 [Fibrobacter sp. UWB13]|nr:hypothetical protein SAMN05720489_1065 [Fibrobacter sp. UWB13]